MIHKTIEHIPDNQQIAAIIRHAERYPIISMLNPGDALLTEKGKQDAYNVGLELAKFCPIKLYYSPVVRCKQTAESIFNGINNINSNVELIGEILDLGGPFVTGDWNKIVAEIQMIGHLEFIRKWFDGNVPSSVIMPLKEAAFNQLQILINQLTINKITAINISHDWNIMILREYFFGLRHEDIGVPDYLDGIAAVMQDKKVHLCYHTYNKIIEI